MPLGSVVTVEGWTDEWEVFEVGDLPDTYRLHGLDPSDLESFSEPGRTVLRRNPVQITARAAQMSLVMGTDTGPSQ